MAFSFELLLAFPAGHFMAVLAGPLQDKVRLPVVPFTTPLSGTVIYIHPKRRFFRVEFENVLGDKIREGYIFADDKLRKMGIR